MTKQSGSTQKPSKLEFTLAGAIDGMVFGFFGGIFGYAIANKYITPLFPSRDHKLARREFLKIIPVAMTGCATAGATRNYLKYSEYSE
jgi:hypothetical protein